MNYLVYFRLSENNTIADCRSATTFCPFLFLVFLVLFLRKIRDLQQRFATDAAHHLSYQR